MQDYIEKLYFEKEGKRYISFIVYDDSPYSPREWDNLGTVACINLRKYTIGDEILSRQEIKELEDDKNIICLPVYIFDHSGIALSTSPFFCPWDSGQIGIIYVDKETIRKEYSVKRVSKKTLEKVYSLLNTEIETYNDYVQGNVYGFYTYELENGFTFDDVDSIDDEGLTLIDSCFGIYGDEYVKQCCFDCI